MKKILNLQVLFALLLAAAPLTSMADTVLFNFNDNFSNGSTLTNATPADPTATNTAYQIVSQKQWNPTPTVPFLTTNDFKVGINGSTSGEFQIQALFATNAVALTQPGDYIQLTVVFTNTSGLLTEAGQLGIGLYNSSQVKPLAGGMNGTASSSTLGVTGGVQNWLGYAAQVNYNGAASRIMTRPAQSQTTGNNQDLITQGSSTASYTGEANVGSTVTTPALVLTTNTPYTEILRITINGTSSLAITNFIYSGPDTNGTLLAQFGGIATNTTFIAGGFDGLAFGYFARASASPNTMDISSILVSGSVTVITQPPTITLQPISVTVATNGSCAFLVNAVGFDVTYQWKRNGTNLLNQGNISGATGSGNSSMLIVNNAGTNDALSSANGYYVTVSGAGGFSTNSVTNSLTLVAATNLTWTDSNPNNVWDLNNTFNWQDNSAAQQVFNYGDPVTFDDTGAGGAVILQGQFLSAASVTVNSSFPYNFSSSSSGSFAGPGNLIYEGTGQLTIGNMNTYSGGTIISNASAHLLLQNYGGLGTGPVTLAMAGGVMEIVPAGSATVGINGDIVSADDFTIEIDGTGSFAGVFLGNLSGTPTKTLTLMPNPLNTTTNDRIRAFGANTIDNANLAINSPLITFASYNSAGSQTYNGVISGTGSFMQKGTTTYFNGPNTYSGGTFPVSAAIALGIDSVGSPVVTSGPVGTGPFLLTVDSTTTLTGSGMLLASRGARTIANPIQYTSGTNNLTLIIGGTNDLTLSGAFTLNGNDNITTNTFTARTVQVTNTGLTTLSGVISDGGLVYGFIKTGNSVLALNNTETYTGPTTNSGGTLQVNGSLNAASVVTVSSNATLAGTGTIFGPVTVNAGGALAPGAATIGTLNINNNLTLSGNIKVRVTTPPGQPFPPPVGISDKAVVSGALTNAGIGTVTVTNLGPALQVGESFTLFNKPLTNGGAMTVTGAGMSWQNNLAIDGSIAVLGTFVLVPTNSARITGFSLVSGNAIINGTNGQSGGTYYLLASTNVATPLSQWTTVATNIVNTNGASGAFTFTGTNVASPGAGQQFYILSNTNN